MDKLPSSGALADYLSKLAGVPVVIIAEPPNISDPCSVFFRIIEKRESGNVTRRINATGLTAVKLYETLRDLFTPAVVFES